MNCDKAFGQCELFPRPWCNAMWFLCSDIQAKGIIWIMTRKVVVHIFDSVRCNFEDYYCWTLFLYCQYYRGSLYTLPRSLIP